MKLVQRTKESRQYLDTAIFIRFNSDGIPIMSNRIDISSKYPEIYKVDTAKFKTINLIM